MKSVKLRDQLKNVENLVGTMINLSDIAISDIYSNLDFDFVWIDTEHAPIEYKDLLTHITVIESKGKNAIVRLQVDNYNHTKRVLEMGPTGVVFPMINTKEDAEKAIASTFFPPKGTRGCGAQRASAWCTLNMAEYRDSCEDDIVRIIQLETKESIDNLEEIVKVKDIDCYLFGPCDLSTDLNDMNNVFGDITQEYVRKAIKILKKHNKSIGVATYATSESALKFWYDLGINFIATGCDFESIRKDATLTLQTVNKIFNK